MYYKKDFMWNSENANVKGLPRPHFITPESFHYKETQNFKNPFRRYLHKIIPIPWQSLPKFEFPTGLNLILENEKKVISDSLCAYCGIQFNDDSLAIRWITQNLSPEENGARVRSDSYPFHLECMKQARIFCPFMRTLSDKDFEIEKYKKLRKDAENDIFPKP